MFYEIVTSFAFTSIVRLIVGFVLAGIIGLERSSWSKPAGFRTHALVGVSAVLVMLCGEYMSEKYNVDPSRIPAQLLSGIGFLGAGTILRNGATVKGLTTAASLLSVTCIGLIIGSGFYLLGIIATVIVYCVLSYSYILFSGLDHFSIFEIEITTKADNIEIMKCVQNTLKEQPIIIKNITNEDIKSDSDEKQKIIRILGKHSKKEEFDVSNIISVLACIEGIIKVEESQSSVLSW